MKFIVNFFMPKMIGQYFNEKVIKPIIYMLFFLVLCFTPVFIEMSKDDSITYTDDISLFMNIRNSDAITYKIEANKLSETSISNSYYGESYGVLFNTEKATESYSLVLSFQENYVNVISYGKAISTINYDKLKDSSLDMSLVQAGDRNEMRKLISYLNYGQDDLDDASMVSDYTSSVFYIFTSFAIVIVFLILSSRFFNGFIPFRIRFNIAIYSASWAYLMYFVGVVSGFMTIFYIGAIISFVFNSIAVKQIVKVERQ